MSTLDWTAGAVLFSTVFLVLMRPHRTEETTYLEGVIETQLGTGVELALLAVALAAAGGLKLYERRGDDRPWISEE
ncbi:hypothetical protein [Haloarcula salinisoli]|uniref:Uncharacterized protein n=1 Tax=Haloarcula salinisoli TaxID=2487746 RepID=A0A8J7YBF9_9EURY|nr:hypothetical protein [Halomicroarcula salinisoli]MBX0286120.1 hypothetical protein [Halomicroarcula salinisoli]MBX0302392.1 hypothetical protein [Halomicroarcula salinisoli]